MNQDWRFATDYAENLLVRSYNMLGFLLSLSNTLCCFWCIRSLDVESGGSDTNNSLDVESGASDTNHLLQRTCPTPVTCIVDAPFLNAVMGDCR
jgi:hypothetical protein